MYESVRFYRQIAMPSMVAFPTVWWLSGAAVDLKFTTSQYYDGADGAIVTSLLSCSRASIGYAQTVAGTLTQFSSNQLRITDKGLLIEDSRTNVLLWDQDLTNAAWTKTSITATLDQTGPDGVANSATRLTATGANGTALQAVTLGSSPRYQSAWVKRITGSGTINMTMDNGATWTAITVTGSWSLAEIPTQTLANPTCGFRIVTNGDEIAVDFVQNENGTFATSPIPTTTAAAARAQDVVQCIGSLRTSIERTPASMVADIITEAVPTDFWGVVGQTSGVFPAYLQVRNSSNILIQTYDGSVNAIATLGNSLTLTGGVKVASSHDVSGTSCVGGGGTVATAGTDLSFAGPTYVGPVLNSQAFYGYFRRLTTWTSRLADVTLQGFTYP